MLLTLLVLAALPVASASAQRLQPAGAPLPADCDDLEPASLARAIELELPILAHKTEPTLRFGRTRQSPAAYARETLGPLLALARGGKSALCAGLAARFALYRPAALREGEGSGHFSAYYHPVVRGSRSRSSAFPIPLYRRPPPELPTLATLTTAEIFAGGLDGRGLELVYLSSLATALLVHVEGSATVQLEEGGEINLTPDGSNGHPYENPYKLARRDRIVPPEQEAPLGWSKMRAYFETHPETLRLYWAKNPRFVFFRETPHRGTGKFGPLVTGRSMAIDPQHVPMGAALWLRTELAQPPRPEPAEKISAQKTAASEAATATLAAADAPSAPAPAVLREGDKDATARKPDGPRAIHVPIARVALAQDTGAGIVGPGRVDVFVGSGPEAQVAAALTSRPGDLYVLKLREPLRRSAPARVHHSKKAKAKKR